MSRGNRFGKLLREVRKSEGWKLREVGALYDLGARIAEEIDALHADVADEREA